jgi:hypothetical protein
MKNKFSNILLAGVMVLAIITGCKKDDTLKHTQVSAVNTLFAPANDAFLKLDPKAGSTDFEWEQARAEDNGVVQYEVVFDKLEGDFSKPLYSYPSEGNGLYNRLTLTHAELNKIASSAGIEALASGKIKWTVRSSKGINVKEAAENRTLEIERPAGFSEMPADLFLTGAASEGGSDLSKAVRFKKTATGVFEIYTLLNNGTYHFADASSGTPKTFSIQNATLKSDGEIEAAGGPKVMRIRVDFNTASVNYTEIESFGVFLSGDNKIIFNLPYAGNGSFKAVDQPVVFKQEGWGRDERYKLQMKVKKEDGSSDTEWFGSTNRDNQAATASSPPAYFYVVPVDNSQYDFSFKFYKEADNKKVDVEVQFHADAPYTHIVTVK